MHEQQTKSSKPQREDGETGASDDMKKLGKENELFPEFVTSTNDRVQLSQDSGDTFKIKCPVAGRGALCERQKIRGSPTN